MKNLIVLVSFTFLVLHGCTQNNTYKETKSFFYKHQDTLSKIVEVLEGHKNSFSIRHNKHVELNGNNPDEGFEISFASGSPKTYYDIILKSNFSQNDSSFLLVKEKLSLNYFQLYQLCLFIEKLEIPILIYFESGSITLLNLKYIKGGFAQIPKDYKQISEDWYYYEIIDPL